MMAAEGLDIYTPPTASHHIASLTWRSHLIGEFAVPELQHARREGGAPKHPAPQHTAPTPSAWGVPPPSEQGPARRPTTGQHSGCTAAYSPFLSAAAPPPRPLSLDAALPGTLGSRAPRLFSKAIAFLKIKVWRAASLFPNLKHCSKPENTRKSPMRAGIFGRCPEPQLQCASPTHSAAAQGSWWWPAWPS
jgi:hypothetical protein